MGLLTLYLQPKLEAIMVIAKPKGKYTYEDYAAKPDDERWELIDGVLYQMAAGASNRHQEVAENLGNLIGDHTRPRRLGRLYHPRFDLILPGETAVEPDLMFVSAARRRIITPRGCEGPPDLVVEVLSPSNPRHDLERKRELYARHGVPEYLILEPYQETLLALAEPAVSAGQGIYRSERLYRPGDNLALAIIPDLTIAVADIFAEPW